MSLERIFPVPRANENNVEHRRLLADALNEIARRLYAEAATDGPLLLAGRPGGQVAHGGTASGDDLELHSNTAEDGTINLGDTLYVDEANGRVGVGTASPDYSLEVEAAGAASIAISNTNSPASTWFFQADNDANRVLNISKNASGGVEVQVNNRMDASGVATLIANGSFQAALNASVGGIGSFGGGSKVLFLANRTTAPSSTPTGGSVAYAESGELWHRGATGPTRLTGLSKRVATQLNKTTTSFTDVAGLDMAAAAAGFYAFEFHLFYDASAAGGHKYRINATNPGNVSAILYHTRAISDATNAFVITARHTVVDGPSGEAGSTAGLTIIEGFVTTTGAVTIRPQFGQQVASGTSSILAGSWGRLIPVGQ